MIPSSPPLYILQFYITDCFLLNLVLKKFILQKFLLNSLSKNNFTIISDPFLYNISHIKKLRDFISGFFRGFCSLFVLYGAFWSWFWSVYWPFDRLRWKLRLSVTIVIEYLPRWLYSIEIMAHKFYWGKNKHKFVCHRLFRLRIEIAIEISCET